MSEFRYNEATDYTIRSLYPEWDGVSAPYTDVKGPPKYTCPERIGVWLTLTLPWLGEVLYCCRGDDCVGYGVELFNDAMAGKYGEIQDPDPLPDEVTDPTAKLKAFLQANPDVAALLK
jgi:hypothetical protein